MSYNALGATYDQPEHVEVATGFYKAIRPLLRGLKGRDVLDLGCGTGLVTERIATHGCRVWGIDLSREMLKVARVRCRRFGSAVRFRAGDLRNFGGVPPPAAAFACADIANHFTSERQLAAFFRNTCRRLEPGGVFVFDALNRWCFETYWDGHTYRFEGPNGDILMECDWDPARSVGTASMIVYQRGPRGLYRRRRYDLRERLYAERTLHRLLREAGFSSVSHVSWSPWTDQHLEASNDRTLWTAIR